MIQATCGMLSKILHDYIWQDEHCKWLTLSLASWYYVSRIFVFLPTLFLAYFPFLYIACLMKMEEWEKALVHTTKVNIYLHSYLFPGNTSIYIFPWLLLFGVLIQIFLRECGHARLEGKRVLLATQFLVSCRWSTTTEKQVGHLLFLIQVLKLEPKNSKALFRSGVVKLNLNKLEEAEEHLKKAEELEPEGKEWEYLALSAAAFMLNMKNSFVACTMWDVPCLPTSVPPTPISPTLDQKVAFHLLIKEIILALPSTILNINALIGTHHHGNRTFFPHYWDSWTMNSRHGLTIYQNIILQRQAYFRMSLWHSFDAQN